MRFGIEWPRLGGRAKRSDRFRVATLTGERHSKVERGIGIVGTRIEHDSKCALGLRELLLVERLPSNRERGVCG